MGHYCFVGFLNDLRQPRYFAKLKNISRGLRVGLLSFSILKSCLPPLKVISNLISNVYSRPDTCQDVLSQFQLRKVAYRDRIGIDQMEAMFSILEKIPGYWISSLTDTAVNCFRMRWKPVTNRGIPNEIGTTTTTCRNETARNFDKNRYALDFPRIAFL